MRIGFLLPGNFALAQPGNGVRVQAQAQADALRDLGHTVVLLNPWETFENNTLDVVHFFSGGFPHYRIRSTLGTRDNCKLVFSPIIDSNVSNRAYRWAAKLGKVHAKIFTIPGELSTQAQEADVVICRSIAERQRVILGLGVQAANAKIVLNGVPPPRTDVDSQAVRQMFDLPTDFCLHISAYTQGRKNVHRLIQAIGPTGFPLVIAGHSDEGSAELATLKLAAKPFPKIRFLGFLPRHIRDSLYAAAKVFCLPSEHEGTGLVALEAASYGAAIVITKNGGPKDYFQDMAEYIEPESVDSIRLAVRRAWAAPQSDRLMEHVNSHLSWQHSAQGLVSAYQ